jgi:hypothetical protein
MTRVMEHSQTRGVTRLVLLVIANHETEDRGAFPAIDRLAREAGSGVRTVQECIRRAEAAGELEVRYRQGPHGTNLYRVLSGLAATATLPGTESTRIRAPQNPHPADMRRESAPERKEQGLGLSVASASHNPPLRAERARPRDELFEALADVEGADLGALTRSARGKLNDATKQLRDIGATPKEVANKAATYRRVHPTWDLTAQALVKHWPSLNGSAADTRPTPDAGLDDSWLFPEATDA